MEQTHSFSTIIIIIIIAIIKDIMQHSVLSPLSECDESSIYYVIYLCVFYHFVHDFQKSCSSIWDRLFSTSWMCNFFVTIHDRCSISATVYFVYLYFIHSTWVSEWKCHHASLTMYTFYCTFEKSETTIKHLRFVTLFHQNLSLSGWSRLILFSKVKYHLL